MAEEFVGGKPSAFQFLSKLCTEYSEDARGDIKVIVNAVNRLPGKWLGKAFKEFAANWERYQKDMNDFPNQLDEASGEFAKFFTTYEKYSQKELDEMRRLNQNWQGAWEALDRPTTTNVQPDQAEVIDSW